MVTLDFIYIGSADLFVTGREQKIQNENIFFQRDSNPLHATPRQENQRSLDRSVTLIRYQMEYY